MKQAECLIPVFSDENGISTIKLLREDRETGAFGRYPGDPLRTVRDFIEGISEPVAELVSKRYDRSSSEWSSPTVCSGRGRPKSWYQFIRAGFEEREIYVASAPSLSGRIVRLKVHKLKFKRTMSQQARVLFARRFMEALQICPGDNLECLKDVA